MSCRETLTLDLADFLARATAPEFAAFRAHYPRCADCAAEVRAWTELHAALSASAHPSTDTLLRYEDARLADPDRRVVAQHLAGCAPCRDELRALAAFDREGARAARPVATRHRWFHLPELGRLVLHPALAYGLVLALLFYPALTGRQHVPEPSADRIGAVGGRRALEESKLEDRVVAAPREEPAASPETPATRQRAAEAPPAAPAPSARAKTDAAEREADATRMYARLGAARSAGTEGLVLSLGSGVQPRLDAPSMPDEVTLQVPVRSGLRAVGPLEVRVIDQSGERELRERVSATAEHVEVRVPRAWLLPGRYRVELRAIGAGAEQDVFAFDVGR